MPDFSGLVLVGLDDRGIALAREALQGGDSVLVVPDSTGTAVRGASGRMKRRGIVLHETVSGAGITLDATAHCLKCEGRCAPLTPLELGLLALLAEDPERAFRYAEISERVWQQPFLGDRSVIASTAKRVRAKLRRIGAPVTIRAARGVGYRLERTGADPIAGS